MPGYIHHIEWCVSDLQATSSQLLRHYGFRELCRRRSANGTRQLVVRSGATLFLLTQRSGEAPPIQRSEYCSSPHSSSTPFRESQTPNSQECHNPQSHIFPHSQESHTLPHLQNPHTSEERHISPHCQESRTLPQAECGEYPLLTCCRTSDSHTVDSVFNVCLEVGDVDAAFERVVKVSKGDGGENGDNPGENGEGVALHAPQTVTDKDGSIRFAVVQSCVSGVIHTLVDTSRFEGAFLPDFEVCGIDYEGREDSDEELTTHMDHITYVCREGQSQSILRWYERCFGMRRFLVNPQDSLGEGTVIDGSVGMRMHVGEWITAWMCRELGVQMIKDDNDGDGDDVRNFKLVLAEPLEGYDNSHVHMFLNENQQPGLQHIGLHTDTIEATVRLMEKQGAQFRRPPPAYYSLPAKKLEFQAAGCDLPAFRQLGLLLDSEADTEASANDGNDDASGGSTHNLIQIFTRPLFQQDTFFLEVLQRVGARGFGAGNITALAESIELQRALESTGVKG